MNDLDQFKKTYFEECADLLALAETKLIGLREGDSGPDDLNAVFRAVHSIKGGAGAFGFESLVRFTHGFETALDELRNGRLRLDHPAHDLLMRGFDLVADLVRASRDGGAIDASRTAAVAAELEAWRGAGTDPAAPVEERMPEAAPASAVADSTGLHRFVIRFRPSPDLLRKANEPLLLIRELRTMGHLEIDIDLRALDDLATLDPEACYLAWTFTLETAADRDAVLEVFEFVTDDAKLEVEDQATAARSMAALAAEEVPPAAAAAGDVVAPPRVLGAAAGSPDGFRTRASDGITSIRVDLDKIDRLINMVGEIVITQAMLSQQIGGLQGDGHREMSHSLEQMAQHTRELQECAMSVRAQPVKSVFGRFPRLVRELAGLLGKEIHLVMTGESTEVDKTVIEQLSDPLIHMVRNAVDHGIEMPALREAAGKPRTGTIVMSAAHRSGRIVIEVTDDGGGIDRARLLGKCIERGLIGADQVLEPEEIDNLIFLPGLSTAERVSDISGRGVGMDVVRRNVLDLGGRIQIRSQPGQGSRFTMSLPLTLAVLDGMVLRVGAERYVLPLTNIIESLRPPSTAVTSLVGRGNVLAIRGEYVQLVYVHRLFGVPGAETDAARGLVVLVEVEGDTKIGLVVDEILGQQQVVIKSLETNYQHIDAIAAATILGDGKVALILDAVGMRDLAQRIDHSADATLRLAS